jgi:hypothetical protein
MYGCIQSQLSAPEVPLPLRFLRRPTITDLLDLPHRFWDRSRLRGGFAAVDFLNWRLIALTCRCNSAEFLFVRVVELRNLLLKSTVVFFV